MEASELQLLESKEAKDRRQYYSIFRVLMVLSFIIPFAGAWYQAIEGAPFAFSPTRYFAVVAFFLVISFVGTYFIFRINLGRMRLDIAGKTKTVEINHIKQKVYFPSKDAYYFYLDSRIKLTIEVSHDEYLRMSEGDEICVEYTTHSKQYLGYF